MNKNLPHTQAMDVLIIGGGIAGLWLLNRLKMQGFSAILLESHALGGGQTICSQGIIHGGLKYALQGALTPASKVIAGMPEYWRACLQGTGTIDLRAVQLLSEYQYLWTTKKLISTLSGFFASYLLSSRIKKLKSFDFPKAFQSVDFHGRVYVLNEMVLDIPSLIQALVLPYQHLIFQVHPDYQILFDEKNNITSLMATSVSGETVAIQAKRYIFTAGQGNARWIKNHEKEKVAAQKRPLHMVFLSHDLPLPLYAHCMDGGMNPKVTITSHPTKSGKTIWYLGGQLAEEGVSLDSDTQIEKAKQLLKELFSWLDFSNATWKSFFIDREEPAIEGQKRPDACFFYAIANRLIAWPTKLAMAPLLADQLLVELKKSMITPSKQIVDAFAHWPHPPLAKTPWNIT